jgi:hypothetical protein
VIKLTTILTEMLQEACWDGYEQQGMKKKGDRMVPNCVRVSEAKKKKKGKINPAYLTKDAAAMKREIDRVKKLKSDDPSAYGKWEADYADKAKTKKYKTKKSAATSAYEKRFGKKNESDGPGAIPEPETKLASQDPETGKISWDVSYDVKPKELYKRVDDLVKFLERAKGNPELDGIRLSLRNLRAKISRLMTQGKL